MIPRSTVRTAPDIARHPIHLGRGGTAAVEPAFTGTLDWYQKYSVHHACGSTEGRLVSMFTFGASWDMWEMHPDGRELVLCTLGILILHQETPNGGRRTICLSPGEYAINEPGTWHTADAPTAATVVFITSEWGTEHRPRSR